MDIVALHRQGHSERVIAKKMGVHRNTVKKYIQEGQTPQYQKGKQRESILAPYYQVIDDFLEEDDYRATWIYKRVKQLGYAGGYGCFTFGVGSQFLTDVGVHDPVYLPLRAPLSKRMTFVSHAQPCYEPGRYQQCLCSMSKLSGRWFWTD